LQLASLHRVDSSCAGSNTKFHWFCLNEEFSGAERRESILVHDLKWERMNKGDVSWLSKNEGFI